MARPRRRTEKPAAGTRRSRKATERPNTGRRRIEQYDHKGQQRKNNPPVGLVTEATDRDAPKKQYAYDPHLDPTLTWAGKAEHVSFEVPTVSLHVHERIDPKTIMEAVRRRNGTPAPVQGSLFELPEENPPLREAIDFYQHAHAWSNRLIAGDSLLVMNSLLEKEGMAGKVQMVYIDPPYGIRYGSNFQPFVNKRDVKDGSDEDLTQEPEMIRAFRDTWELGIHSYLTYLRDRLLLARELLHESGSCFVQISDENVHLVRNLMDQVFGVANHVVTIAVKKKGSQKSGLLDPVNDYVVWYSRTPLELAWEEARTLSPRPGILAFAAFQFDPEAAKDIDELTREKTGMTFLKVQMNPDLLTEDLKKKRTSNESFWLMGQPDVEVRAIGKGEHKGKLAVEVHGFDYYNTKTGQIESGDTGRIALWMLDTDYDGRSLFPRQVFFPMADESGGWARLARNLKAEIDAERVEAYRGTVSLPFEAGAHRRVAVKIVDDRGIESLKIIPVP
ncbi:MAG: hypothetical protein HYY95_13855 [Candidatus Rokubacteria bacterium]|nr:hypothetical protein [Candidatus Rokubacteria bacterium]